MIEHTDHALSNGIRLHVAHAGDAAKPMILFLHGFPEFWFAWEKQLDHFGQDHFAVAPDLRGFNLSDQPHEVAQYRAKYIIEDIRLLVEKLGQKKCVLVAHDWGGAIGWAIAALLPQLVEKLVVINSPHGAAFQRDLANDAEQIKASEYMNWLRREGSEAKLMEDDFALIEKFLGAMSDIRTWYTPEIQEQYRACWARGLRGGCNYYRASPLHPATETEPGAKAVVLPDAMTHVDVPTLVIWGEADHALKPKLLDGLGNYVANLTVERIPEGSHWIVHEQPDRVNQLIRGFIRA